MYLCEVFACITDTTLTKYKKNFLYINKYFLYIITDFGIDFSLGAISPLA